MKKLMFAAALAASAAAFADGPINATAFANSGEYNPNTANSYFYFAGDSDSSVVTNEPAESIHTKHTANFSAAEDANYLALDTEGGTLWRSLSQIRHETVNEVTTNGLGTAQSVAATGTYLDTLVQFTVTEDEEPTLGEDDKLAIWLQADNGTTNLMVKAGLINDLGTITKTNFTLNATVNPGEWYRLTVKALEDFTDNEGLPGFQIYLDGTLLTSSTPTLTSEYLEILSPDDVDDSHYADIVAGKYFASLKTGSTLQGVGFQGTGAVDEIVWTEEDLFPAGGATPIEFTLTGAANAAVSYVIGSEASQDWDGSSTITVDSGATVTFTAAPASGYTYTGVTAEGWTLDNGNLVCETNSTENITLAVPNAVALVTLTDPGIANATLTSPTLPAQYAPGATVELTWTAAPGYTFPNGQTTLTRTITVGTDDLAAIAAEVESSLSKQTFTVTVTDIENATIAATTNNTDLVDALSENTTTNQYTVEYGATVTVTATAAQGYEYATAPEGWTLNAGVLSIETNVTAAVELAAPVPMAVLATVNVTVTGGANATAAWTVDGASVADAPATLTEGQTYEVTFTADSGYEFAAGATTTFSGTVGNEDITIAAPNATAIPVTVNVTVTGGANATAAWEVDGASVAEAPATLTEGQTWSVTLTADTNYEFNGNSTTNLTGTAGDADFTIALPDATLISTPSEGWVDNVADIPANATVAEQYPTLASSAIATADAVQVTTWAKGTGNVAFSDAGSINVEAFLLNIANDSTTGQIDAAKEAFVLNITVAADGTPTVTLPSGKTYNGKVQMKGSNDLSTWTNVEAASKTYHFYKYELSIPTAE